MSRPVPPEHPTRLFVMVTGASSGIGRATAARLADAGHVVFAAARRARPLEALAAEHPGAHPIVLDVTDRESIDDARERVRVATGGHGLDVLVNAAGRMILGPLEATPNEHVRAQFEVNLFGLLAVTRAFVPSMRERGAGRIVNVSSVVGRFALPGQGVYSASKFALEACSDALRMELAPFGVRVVLVEPGVTDTPLYESATASVPVDDEALKSYRWLWPAGFGPPPQLLKTAAPIDSVAGHVVKAVLAPNPRPRYRPGLRNRINIRLLTMLPTRIADRIKTRVVGMLTGLANAGEAPNGTRGSALRGSRRRREHIMMRARRPSQTDGLLTTDADLVEEVRSEAGADAAAGERAGRAAELIRTRTGRRWVGIYRVAGSQVRNLAWSGAGAPAYPNFPIERGLTGAAIRSRSTVVSNDVANDPRYLTNQESTGSELIVPVLLNGTVVGTLDIEDAATDAFGEQDRRLFEHVAAALVDVYS